MVTNSYEDFIIYKKDSHIHEIQNNLIAAGVGVTKLNISEFLKYTNIQLIDSDGDTIVEFNMVLNEIFTDDYYKAIERRIFEECAIGRW